MPIRGPLPPIPARLTIGTSRGDFLDRSFHGPFVSLHARDVEADQCRPTSVCWTASILSVKAKSSNSGH